MPSADERRARRAWIAEHHPDRGGDPHAFAAGLAALTGTADHRASPTRPTVIRSRRPDRTVRRWVHRITKARRRRTHHGSI